MSASSYETMTYKWKFRRALKGTVIFLIICAVVIAPSFWCWNQSVVKRQVLREAKNVLLNMELLSLEYFGFQEALQDSGRNSGLTRDAEEEIRSFSGAEGDIHLISWNSSMHCVGAMTYQRDHYLMYYRYDETEEQGVWNVYWKLHEYEA